jgi:hypothetical protein
MVQLRSYLNPADNSGAKKMMIIGVPGKLGKMATLGQVVLCVVKGADPNGAVKDHEKISRDEPLVEPLDEDEDTDEWGALPSFLRKKKENK